jgi:hypothetical protein
MTEAARVRLKAMAPYLGIIGLNLAYRFPVILNARAVHSDAAIVGLQAMHILRGEYSRFLWGADYQGSFDAWLIAFLFAIFGINAFTLMLGPLLGHLVMCCSVLAGLKRIVGPWPAFISCLVLVFTPQAINGVVMYAPRQWSITFAVCGAVIIAWPSARLVPLRIAGGLCLSLFALYLDMFCLQWMPAVLFLAVLACFDPPRELKLIAQRAAGLIVGLAIGALAVSWLRDSGAPKQHGFDISTARIPGNWALMRDTCLPWLLGAKVWISGKNLYPDQWIAPGPVAVFQYFGAAVLFLMAIGSTALAFSKRIDWILLRVTLFGAGAAGTALSGFLVSGWPSDMWSTRYLAPIIWAMPFTLAPLEKLLRPRGFAVLLAPYLMVAAFAGWLAYGSYVDGPLPRLDPRGAGDDEEQLGKFLVDHGYEHGFAQYWLAYRLTFLWKEKPILAPFEFDRYHAYRQQVMSAKKVAYIYHPSEPRAVPQTVLSQLVRMPGTTQVGMVGSYTVVLYDGTTPRTH